MSWSDFCGGPSCACKVASGRTRLWIAVACLAVAGCTSAGSHVVGSAVVCRETFEPGHYAAQGCFVHGRLLGQPRVRQWVDYGEAERGSVATHGGTCPTR